VADRATQSLLRSGVIVGPLYLAVGLAQAFTREGFDFARHPLSVLANGPGGWVQTANFVVSGLLVIAAAAGIRRALGSRATSFFLSVFGAGMLVAAVFRADPVDGFPPGTPEGFPTAISTAGMIHFIAGTLGFMALAISCFSAAAAFRRRGAKALAGFSLLSGLAVLLGFFGGAMLGPAGITGIWFSVVMGWAWLAVVSLQLYRASPEGAR
jgi:hypothetical membrane protein